MKTQTIYSAIRDNGDGSANMDLVACESQFID